MYSDNDNTKLAALVEAHDCDVNHDSSSGAIEVEGDLRILKQLMEHINTIYKKLRGMATPRRIMKSPRQSLMGKKWW